MNTVPFIAPKRKRKHETRCTRDRNHRLGASKSRQPGGADHRCRTGGIDDEAFEAGASLVHIHVRNPDETPSSDPQLFKGVMEGVRRHCPGMIVQFSTGGRGRDPSARGSALYLRPEMASLSTGSVNFPTIVYENPPSLIDELVTDHEAARCSTGNRGL